MKIAVLSTVFLKDYLKNKVDELTLDCEIQIFIYYNYEHLIDLYKQYEHEFDGFITTGPIPLSAVQNVIQLTKPFSFFECGESNYYKTFFQIIHKYGDTDFTQGYFDFCDYLYPLQEHKLIEHLAEGDFNNWLVKNNNYMTNMTLVEILDRTKEKLQTHIDLWNSGKIKYSLSRMSTIMPELLEAGVNCHFIYFSDDDVFHGINNLMKTIIAERLKNSGHATIDILISNHVKADDEAKNNKKIVLSKLLNAFKKKYFCDFIIRETTNGFRISTNYKTVSDITNNFTACLLREYINDNNFTSVSIGYGLGNNLNQSETNAKIASGESKNGMYKTSYAITSKNKQIGLFGQSGAREIQLDTTPYVQEISNITGLSPLSIQKILHALKILGTNEVTATDIANTLHITIRSVNRIISKLVFFNMAVAIRKVSNNTKGRPLVVYRILLNNK